MSNKDKNDFERIRSDHRTEIFEDYLEAIAEYHDQNGQCRGADLARHFSVSHATVTQTLARLKDAGLIDSEPYGPVGLTRKGRNVARKSRERHEVVFSFLLAIGVSESVAAADAEGMEHHVSDETLERFTAHIRNTSKRNAD